MSGAPLFVFLAKLIDLVSFIWKRKAAKNDDPITKAEKWKEQVHNEVANDDEPGANARVDDMLFRFRMRKNKGDTSRQANKTPES